MTLKVDEGIGNLFAEEQDTKVVEKIFDDLVKTRIAKDKAEKQAEALKSKDKELVQQLVKAMSVKKLKSFKREDGVSVSTVVKEVFYVKSETKPTFLKTIKKIGWESFVKEDMAWQSIQSQMKALLEKINDENLEDDLKLDAKSKYTKLIRFLDQKTDNNVQVRGLTKLKNKKETK